MSATSLDRVAGQVRARAVLAAMAAKRMAPPALIFAGPEGVGRGTAARAFADLLSCERGTGCGRCTACRENGFGEGFRVFDVARLFDDETEKNRSRAFRREISSHVTARRARAFVIVIRPAELLNETMQAALLKALEEPAPGVCYVLVCRSAAQLSSTLRSRSVLVRFTTLAAEEVVTQLERILGRKLSEREKTIAGRARGSVTRALELVEKGVDPSAFLDEIGTKGRARGGKEDRADILRKLEEALPGYAEEHPHLREPLLDLDRAIADKAHIPLAVEVFRRRARRRSAGETR